MRTQLPGVGATHESNFAWPCRGSSVIFSGSPCCSPQSPGDPVARRRCPAFALQAGLAVLVLYTPWDAPESSRCHSGSRICSAMPLRAPSSFRAERKHPLANNVRDRRLAGDHLFREPRRDPLLSRDHAAHRSLVGGAIGWVTGISRCRKPEAAANIFVGQSESPLVIRPYLAALTPAQLFTVMTVGMAGVAGTILAAYAALLGSDYLPYLLAAAFMSAPGGILMAKIIMPDDAPVEGELPLEGGSASVGGSAAGEDDVDVAETFEEGVRPANVIMAAAQGAQTGVKLAVAVGAMVLAFVALVALANGLLGGIGGWFGQPDLSFQMLVGFIFAPIMF